MFRSRLVLVHLAATVMSTHVEAWASGPLSTLSMGATSGGMTPTSASTAQAAAAAGAFVSSNQAQIQNQTQIQNDSQVQALSLTTGGGQGGSANNAGNNQLVSLNTSGMHNNPGIGLGLMAPTAPCRDTYSVGASAVGMGGALAWSKADRECRLQDIGTAFIRAGFIEDGLAMWCAIDGVEDTAPTCKKLKAAKQSMPQAAEMSDTSPIHAK